MSVAIIIESNTTYKIYDIDRIVNIEYFSPGGNHINYVYGDNLFRINTYTNIKTYQKNIPVSILYKGFIWHIGEYYHAFKATYYCRDAQDICKRISLYDSTKFNVVLEDNENYKYPISTGMIKNNVLCVHETGEIIVNEMNNNIYGAIIWLSSERKSRVHRRVNGIDIIHSARITKSSLMFYPGVYMYGYEITGLAFTKIIRANILKNVMNDVIIICSK